jgi:metal-responsive CopG/Arc/MetJ family transcriptional regulator
METIQVVLEPALLKAADRAARRFKINRSKLVRDALRAHLSALAVRDREQADRAGYRQRTSPGDGDWDRVAAWPED